MDILKKILESFGFSKAPQKANTGFIVQKDLTGQWRWFAWVTNKWVDLEDDIFVDSAHREFMAYLDANPDLAPELWIWHLPETKRKYRADWWEYANGFVMYSGILTDEEAAPYVQKGISEEPLGMSHMAYVLERYGKYILKYRTVEVTELPLNAAANPYTSFNLLYEQEIKDMFSPRKRQFLVERLGEESVAKLEGATEDMEKQLEEMDVEWKSLNEEYEAQLEKERAEAIAEASKGIVAATVDEVMKALNVEDLQAALKTLFAATVEAKEAVQALDARLDNTDEKVKHLMETEDERLAKALAPQEPMNWGLSVKGADAPDKADTTNNVRKDLDWLQQFNPTV